jgi:hypothetical protein
MTQTPYADGVEEYPHQYASTHGLGERLKRQHGLSVERDGYALVVNGARVTCEPRKGEPDLWFYVDGVPVDPITSPDATMRVVGALPRR